ncbi:MAG: hypothetical protein FWF84_02845 [Kiritimatiellaeota bacterium]|nr:hypothetical protein [Kiritimatiellota bacterium]
MTNVVSGMLAAVVAPLGRPVLSVNGEAAPEYDYVYNLCSPVVPGGESEAVLRKFAAHGCKTFMFCIFGGVDNDWGTTPFWTDDDVFPEDPAAVPGKSWQRTVDQINFLMELVPDARFWLRYNCSPPKRWVEKFPDELLLNSAGKRYAEPSLASDRYDRQVGRFVEHLVGYCERQPWADRVVGYLVYPLGEGTTQLTVEGYLFDRSPAMTRGFRAWLSGRYGSDEALAAAWSRPGVTLATAEVPEDGEFKRRGRELGATLDVFATRPEEFRARHRLHWPDPAEVTAERDYCLYMRELTKRNFATLSSAVKRAAPTKLTGLDAFKQAMLGWPLVARWTGDYQNHEGSMHAVSGAFDMAELLDDPNLDVVCTPHDYLHRGMGFPYDGEGIGDAVVLRRKMMLMEEDQRTYCRPEANDRWNMLRQGPEVPAGLWRNFGTSVTRGWNTYPMDVNGPSFFMGDDVQEVLRQRCAVAAKAATWAHEEVPSAVLVIDDTSVLEEDFTFQYQHLAVIQQRLYGLARCGVPYRQYLFDDLAHENFFQGHKLFLFPNLFKLTPERVAFLREKVLCNGNVAVFGPATGITDGTLLRADLASELLGIPLELVRKESPRWVTIDRFDHPLTASLPRRIDYGDSLVYGPLLRPKATDEAVRLGGIQWPTAEDGPGLLVREFGRGASGNGKPGTRGAGDCAVVFTAAVPLPPELLRSLAAYSGTHVYSDSDDDVVFANANSFGVHAVRPGTRTYRLPAPARVWDLIGDTLVSERTDTLTLTIDPPQTFFFQLRP